MSLCTKTHLVSDAGGESPTPTHSSAALGATSALWGAVDQRPVSDAWSPFTFGSYRASQCPV